MHMAPSHVSLPMNNLVRKAQKSLPSNTKPTYSIIVFFAAPVDLWTMRCEGRVKGFLSFVYMSLFKVVLYWLRALRIHQYIFTKILGGFSKNLFSGGKALQEHS